jgi:hypothetical protein
MGGGCLSVRSESQTKLTRRKLNGSSTARVTSTTCVEVLRGSNAVNKSFAISFVCCLAALVNTGEAVAAPPKQIYGKSVVLSWNETRTEESAGFRILSLRMSIYVSTEGRMFRRVVVTRGNRRRGLSQGQQHATASQEHGPGEGPPPGVKVGRTEFAGHSLIITTEFQSGARQITVDFDGSFTGCQAKVVHGKEAGVGTMRQTSAFGGKQVEFRAIEVSGVTCSVKDGNVFTEF